MSVTLSSCRLYNNLVKEHKFAGKHIINDRGACFLSVIMSSSRAMLPPVSREANFFFVKWIKKQLVDSAFMISRMFKVSVRVKLSTFGFGW